MCILADEHITPTGFTAPLGNILYVELMPISVKLPCTCDGFFLPGHTHKPNLSKAGPIFKHKLRVEDSEHDLIFLFWLRLHLPEEYKIHSRSIWVFTFSNSCENPRVSQKLAHFGSLFWSSVHIHSFWFTYYFRLTCPWRRLPRPYPHAQLPESHAWV